ncbi:alpha-1,3-arabinosyltransferase XAT3-like [Rhododendron vialii]|uniref:alpha-1,3-arabinosyltransferase XAT3-like n=1 Tax=Rhododendron vialii TaxID=182163 RepID=UPI00265F4C0C|nr:alpha-1,3-arabinosyltransferase XAT3-like [Rhododendron vialii]
MLLQASPESMFYREISHPPLTWSILLHGKLAGKTTYPVESRIQDQHHLDLVLERLLEGDSQILLEANGFACHSDIHTEVCVSNRPVKIDTSTMTVYAPFSEGMIGASHTMSPYARKDDEVAMSRVSPVQILQGSIIAPPACRYNHDVPAVVFSSGGFAGMFHEFNEVIIPLFLTTRHFQSRLSFIVNDYRPSLVDKFDKIISHLSSYEVINPTENGNVHCFPGVVVGLHFHDNLAINTTVVPEGYSMLDFKQFLRDSYNLKIQELSQTQTEKPRLILVSREKSRAFLNEHEMVTMMRALGFRVVIAKPHMMANTENFAKIVNSCSVMVGAHGAGLTNIVFLPEGAVLVQVVGLALEWPSTHYFGTPATGMGLNYIEYKIEPEESSLISHYGRDHPVIADPASINAKGYQFYRAAYLIEQSFNIDVVRFNKTLVQALGLVRRSAPLG